MSHLYPHRVRLWMAANADDHPFSLIDSDVLMSKLLVPSSNWPSEIYNSSEPQITMETVMTLPMGPPGISRTKFLKKLVDGVRRDESEGVNNTYTMKTSDGRRYTECETPEFGHLFLNPNIHKINSDSNESSVTYLEEKLDYIGARPVNILGASARNLTFLITPTYYETPMHNDETDSLVCSLPINTGVKIWMTLSDGMSKRSHDDSMTKMDMFNRILSQNTAIQYRMMTLINTFPQLRIAVLFGGMTIFNPYNQSHSVITYGQYPFVGIGQQIVSRCDDTWLEHLMRMLISRKSRIRDVLHMLEECSLDSSENVINTMKVQYNKSCGTRTNR